jgi:RHS repeat-associated protein
VDYDPETHTFPVMERAFHGGRVLSFGADYDLAQGALLRYRDPAGVETAFQWDALHRLVGIVKPGDTSDQPTLAFQYVYGNARSYVVSKSRVEAGKADVIEKRLWYDGLGRQLATVEQAEGGRTVTSGLKDFGPLGGVIREYESQFTDGYDIAAPATRFTEHRYDALGRRTHSLLPDGSASEHRFSPFAVELWDAEDLDPASPHHATPRTERLTALGLVQIEERLGSQTLVTKLGRDPLGRIASVTDALGNLSTWTRDGLGRTVEVNDPDAGVTSFDFDDGGNLRHRTDARGAYVATDYDELGRPLAERLIDAGGKEEEKVRYHYDDPSPLFSGDVATGELSWVEDGAGEEHYRRDERGRLVELVRKVDGKSYQVQHAYDDLDRLTSRTFPDDRSLDYRYNPRSLLESVPGVISSIAYDPRGLVTRREHANGAVTTASYDDLRRISMLGTESRGKAVQSLGYRYDQVGNLTAIDDALRKSGPLSASRTCGYDDLYRLVSAVGGDHSWTYAFNAVGDFTKKSDVGEYSYAKAHLVASAGGKSYRHDEAGNVVERPGSKLAFDAKGRLKSVALEDGTAVTYRYDYTGRRVVKESRGPKGDHKTVYVDAASEERDGQAIDYVMAGRTRLARLGGKEPVQVATAGVIARVPPALSALAATLLALALLFRLARAQVPARSAAALGSVCSLLVFTTPGCSCGHSPGAATPIPATHYHGDHLGGTTLLTAQDGSVAAEIAYDPWGAEIVGASEPYAFTGKEYEPDTGLYDYAARVYDPVLARFLSPDPLAVFEPGKAIGDPGTGFRDHGARKVGPDLANPANFNRYSYVLNNPYKYVDPTGRDAIPVAFPDYKIGTPIGRVGGLGHAGIVLINSKSGASRYYEYGRYDPEGKGWVKRQTVPDVVMGKDGRPTADSMKRLLSAVSEKAGHGGRVEGAYVQSDSYDKMVGYAESRKAANSDPKREPYGITDNNCGTFMKQTLEAGGVDTPWMIDPRPNSYIKKLQSDFPRVQQSGAK